MPPCSFYVKNGYCNDEDCCFKHIDPEEKKECPKYKAGFCPYGPKCKFRHDRQPPEEIPSNLPDWYVQDLVRPFLALPKIDHLFDMEPVPDAPLIGKNRYFMIKSLNRKNIELSVLKGVWATSKRNYISLVDAYRNSENLVLIYGVNEIKTFLGMARMVSEPKANFFPNL
mmetsp:Transcript_12567/g.6246  ORF Transcript_12567/g.6246 Transcript_12567/m.6246 type:complete len:170 (-) Transcript_12567:301-810(-)|eukprot:CAMPEP_0201281488 /NCGR_PEP_ID=MMETSP1317-20130820/2904_1 /ASSEMBLY_ACC=CAM_ASM_000770 /TAXON_ID=187299 /ORGANISM="Undescribed Undescribed, Strain Undescribed" /LENGTH=169 /DNA_ID=CAMNT_0047591363 /DNA_START=158 /DNA_END=667 /DNA_ORIENTATION=-